MEQLSTHQRDILLIGSLMERFLREERRWPVIEEIRELIDWVHWNGEIPAAVRLREVLEGK